MPKKIPLTTWAARHYDPVPSPWVLRRWARDGEITPAPERVGREWYVLETAELDPASNEVPFELVRAAFGMSPAEAGAKIDAGEWQQGLEWVERDGGTVLLRDGIFPWRTDLAAPAVRQGVRTALYRHFDASGGLLYVGISLSAIARLLQHQRGAHWSQSIARIDVEWFDSRGEAARAEAAAIRHEAPLHNVAGAPK